MPFPCFIFFLKKIILLMSFPRPHWDQMVLGSLVAEVQSTQGASPLGPMADRLQICSHQSTLILHTLSKYHCYESHSNCSLIALISMLSSTFITHLIYRASLILSSLINKIYPLQNFIVHKIFLIYQFIPSYIITKLILDM